MFPESFQKGKRGPGGFWRCRMRPWGVCSQSMKASLFARALSLWFATVPLFAESNPIPLLRAGTNEFRNAQIRSVSNGRAIIKHDKGMSSIPVEQLPEDFRPKTIEKRKAPPEASRIDPDYAKNLEAFYLSPASGHPFRIAGTNRYDLRALLAYLKIPEDRKTRLVKPLPDWEVIKGEVLQVNDWQVIAAMVKTNYEYVAPRANGLQRVGLGVGSPGFHRPIGKEYGAKFVIINLPGREHFSSGQEINCVARRAGMTNVLGGTAIVFDYGIPVAPKYQKEAPQNTTNGPAGFEPSAGRASF